MGRHVDFKFYDCGVIFARTARLIALFDRCGKLDMKLRNTTLEKETQLPHQLAAMPRTCMPVVDVEGDNKGRERFAVVIRSGGSTLAGD